MSSILFILIIIIIFGILSKLSILERENFKKKSSCKKPIFNEELWNHSKFVDYNNCYSYAINEPDSSLTLKRYPAREITTVDYDNYTCKYFDHLMQLDNPKMYSVSKKDSCECNEYKIALVLDDNGTPFDDDKDDFHFYRQDEDTDVWSHKRGNEELIRTDAVGEKIYDPETANRRYKENGDGNYNYDKFCGFYCMPYSDKKYNTALKEIE